MLGPAACRGLEFPGAGNVLIQRSVFDEVGTFDQSLAEAGEDIDFFRRVRKAGIVVWIQPAAVVHHRVLPSRLEPAALLAASRRVGWGFCRRDFKVFGGFGLFALCAARSFKFAAFGSFRYGMARLTGNPGAMLGLRIDAARNWSYFKAAAGFLLPALLVERFNLQAPVFRQEAGRAKEKVAVSKR